MRHPLRRRARTARLVLAAAKIALLGSIVAAGWADAATSTGAVPAVVERHARDAALPGAPAAGATDLVLQRELDVHRCSVSGFPDGRTPRSALVRTATGRLRHVSFDDGWRVYTAHGSATLVAVCLDRPRAGRLRG